MTTRASIIMWSAGSGMLLGLFADALLIGLWALLATAVPSLAPRNFPRWASVLATLFLAAVPIATATLGYLEGRLKVD
jgi:hypothetical protein